MKDFHQYDDGDYDSAVETDQPVKAGAPVDPTDVLRLEDIEGRLLNPASVVNIANPTELNSVAGVLGALVLAYQIVGAGGLNIVTLYAYDVSGPAVNAPYIMDASGGGAERWIAIAGRYAVQGLSLLGDIVLTGTVDGIDISVHVANVDAHHAQVHLVSSHSDTNLGAISNNDLMQWNDPASRWLPKSIAEVILAQNINPGAIRLSLTIYANNAAAIAAGLIAGDFYRNGADPDLVCVVH